MIAARILCGGVRQVLPTLPERSVQCCVTSPPYWGLRDYGHEGQLGLERTPEEYVSNMVAVFREVRRVLRDDGVLWLNLGDSYARDAGKGQHQSLESAGKHARVYGDGGGRASGGFDTFAAGIKAKDLVGIPWRVAFAIQADGWYLRSDCIWSKPNPMPESVTDRPTKAHEYLFLLAKSERYFYDADAIAEEAIHAGRTVRASADGAKNAESRGIGDAPNGAQRTAWGFTVHDTIVEASRNRRTVWTIATQPYSGAHFAVMPEALVEPCILAGSSEGDTVLDPFCGSGTVGVVALKRGRTFLGIELNPNYAQLAKERIEGDAPLLNRAEVV